jgi:hypothetical protein
MRAASETDVIPAKEALLKTLVYTDRYSEYGHG